MILQYVGFPLAGTLIHLGKNTLELCFIKQILIMDLINNFGILKRSGQIKNTNLVTILAEVVPVWLDNWQR